MRINIWNCLLIIAFALCTGACNNDDEVQIQTLSSIGDDFYFGEKVVVWTGVQSGNADNLSYEWECDGGSFLGSQKLFENIWIAPAEKGIYTVRVKVKQGSKISIREKKMNVTPYFFYETFENKLNSAGFVSSSALVSYIDTISNDGSVQKVKLEGNSTSKTAYASYYLPMTRNLKFPFSLLWNAGFESFRTINSSYLQLQILFKYPEDLTSPFIQKLTFQYYPLATGSTKNLMINFSTLTPNTNVTKSYDIVPSSVNSFGTQKEKEYADFSISFGTDSVFYAYKNGVQIISSDQIRDWLREHPNETPIVDRIIWSFPGSKPQAAGYGTTYLLDNIYILNNGSVLKSTDELLNQ